jgi:ACS family hexuronate transporter-like MFS transporter
MSDGSPQRDSFRWTILGLIFVSHIIGASAQYGINTLAPFYKDEMGLSRAQVGLFFSAFYLAMTGASFGTGWLADRLGVRKTTLLGHLGLGVCTTAAAFSPSFESAWVSFFLAGFGYSFLNPASSIGVMTWFDRDERATAMGIKQTGVPGGGVLAAILAPSLVLLIGWRGSLAALGIINFAFGFLFALLWREPVSASIDADPTKSTDVSLPPLNVWALLPISCATAIYLIGQMALITYVPLYLKDVMGYSPYWASQALALTQAGAMVGRVGWGVASDRLFGGRRKIVLIVIGLLSVLLLGALGFMDRESSYWLLMPILFLAGVSLVGYQGVSYALIGEISGKARTGAGLGMMITINAAAATIGTPVFGYIVDQTGSYAFAWQILAVAVAVGIIAVTFLLKEPRSMA